MLFIIVIGVLIISLLFGYFFWKSANDNYNYNVFNIGVVIRIVIGILACFLSIEVGIGLLLVLTIWNFIVVYKNTSLFTAILFLIFQPAAFYFAFWILTRKWD